MWHASQHGGSPKVGCESSASRHTKGGFSWPSSSAQTGTASPGRRNTRSPLISASRARRCNSRSRVLSRSAQSSSTSRGARGGRLATGSPTSLNWTDARASWRRSTSPIHGASWGSATSPTVGHEVRTSHVRRSAVAMRALPGARRSLRSLCVFTEHPINRSSTIGRLAGRCPCGEQAQHAVTMGTRQRHGRHVPACSRSCRLPAALAGDDEQERGWVSSLAVRGRRGIAASRFAGRVQYARGLAS